MSKFKIIGDTHVTQIERKHLAAFLDSGMTSAKVNTKTYVIESGDQKELTISIHTPYRNDFGAKRYNKQIIKIERL